MKTIFNNNQNYAVLDFNDEYIDEFDFNPTEILYKIKKWANENNFLINKITWNDIPIHLVPKGYYTVGVLYITEQKMMQDVLKELDTMERLNPTHFAMRENKKISERIERYKKFKEWLKNEGN